MSPSIYLDHHATTPVDPRVLEAMLPYFTEEFGNASSRTHAYGLRAAAALEDARERIAAAIGAADPGEIVFTSGTTESDNLALQGVARAGRARRSHLVTTRIEHHAVLDPCRALEAEGFSVSYLSVDAQGTLDPADVAAALSERTALVSVAAANGEVGGVQPLTEIAALCRERGVLLHSDAAQAIGRIDFDVRAAGVDLCAFCAHKIYGPKGVGALYVRSGRPRVRIAPLLHGGGQERGLRSGTLPVPLIVGFARALEICRDELASESARLRELRERLWTQLQAVGGAHRNGPAAPRLPGNLNVSFEGIDAVAVLTELEGIALSTGSACASGRSEPSHVLAALGVPPALARGAIRFGIGRGNTPEEIDTAAQRIAEAVRAHRRQRRGGAQAGVGGAI
ncbi:MAG: cysteine desulfurase [Myxococcales bacterium]|nr:cysteine desulfurase [Myxococcales bacterium]